MDLQTIKFHTFSIVGLKVSPYNTKTLMCSLLAHFEFWRDSTRDFPTASVILRLLGQLAVDCT